MMQRWFAGTRHASAHNPYFLYAASNVGSFASLLLYPSVIEPALALSTQTRLWSLGYSAAVVLTFLAIWSYFGGAIARIAAFEIAKDGERIETRKALQTVSKVLNIGWIADALSHEATTICSRSNHCPRPANTCH